MNITMKLANDTQAHALVACLGSYSDNEHDKGPEGIGEDLQRELAEVLKQLNESPRLLLLNLAQLSLVHTALDIHNDGCADEIWEDLGFDTAIASMCERLDALNINA